MLKYDFVSYSPGSRTLADFLGADCEADDFDAPDGMVLLREEVARTARAHGAAAPGRIARGSLSLEEADRTAKILAAIGADLTEEAAHLRACRAHFATGGDWRELPVNPLPRAGDFSWEDKLHVLRRELHFRRRYDADRIAKGRATAADAKAELERLEAVQHKYWWELFCWASPSGAAAGTPAWRAEVREHDRLIELAASAPAEATDTGSEDAPQEAMTL